MLEPLPGNKVLIDQVYERLVEAIADGTMPPGMRIRQDEIAALLGISRQPVSHALQLLKRQGLLIVHGRKGLAVAPIDPGRVRDLYRVRAALDGLAARLAAECARAGTLPPTLRQQAEATITEGAGLVGNAGAGDMIRADVAFHTALYRMAGNSAIEETITPQWPHFMRSMGAVLVDKSRGPRIWSEHRMILDAILSGDEAGAAALAIGHAERAGEDVAARIRATAAA